MTRLRRGFRQGADRGSVSLFFVVASAGLMVTVGLVVDGGGKVRALQRAEAAAAEAARQGGQAVDAARVNGGQGVQADVARARAAAQVYLASAGVDGSVTVTGGTRLEVSTTTSYTPVFLSLLQVGPMTTRGHAEARLVRALDGER